jgi:Domain of unknown function (DUF4287)
LVALARGRGYGESTKAGVIVDWLEEDFDLGRGHAMALVNVIKNGAEIGDKHVGTTCTVTSRRRCAWTARRTG